MSRSLPYDVITFDCYGTLIDWETGIVEAFRSEAAKDGVDLDPGAILRAHAAIEPRVQAEGYRLYRDVLGEVARRAASALGWHLPDERSGFLAASLTSWRPFADTNPALERLRAAGLKLGILSNIDDDLLAGTRQHFTVPFDFWVTAEQVQSYKPAPAHFARARTLAAGHRWLHVGASYFHDVEPTTRLGVPVVWVNRGGAAPGGTAQPTAEVRDLTGLADWLDRGAG